MSKAIAHCEKISVAKNSGENSLQQEFTMNNWMVKQKYKWCELNIRYNDETGDNDLSIKPLWWYQRFNTPF